MYYTQCTYIHIHMYVYIHYIYIYIYIYIYTYTHIIGTGVSKKALRVVLMWSTEGFQDKAVSSISLCLNIYYSYGFPVFC